MLAFALASVLRRGRPSLQMPVHQSLCIHMLTGSVLFSACTLFQGCIVPPLSREFAIGMVWLALIATFLTYAIYYTMPSWKAAGSLKRDGKKESLARRRNPVCQQCAKPFLTICHVPRHRNVLTADARWVITQQSFCQNSAKQILQISLQLA
jgi:hypothetical protein